MPGPVTHLSIAAVVGRHAFRGYLPLVLFSTMAPDIDGLAAFVYILFTNPFHTTMEEGQRIFTAFHPSFSSSLLVLPFFAIVFYLLFRLIKPRWTPERFWHGYFIVLAAMLVHIGLDLLMTGNRPFWPFPLEAGLGVIPYTTAGSVVPPFVAALLLALDILVFKRQGRIPYN